jgi:mannitol-1-/sugar-/sorbitol-6-/2-deoxyglucose-6-phosphatase
VSPKAVIFDMDGVIIDSEPIWRQAEKEAFKIQSIILTDDMCRSTAGLRLMQVIEHWQKRFGFDNEIKELLFKTVHERVVELILSHGKAFEGLNELLEKIKAKGIKLALASGSSYTIIEAVLKKLDIKDYFDVIRSGDDEAYGKPHPQIFISTAMQLNIAVEDCIVIEDSRNGVLAAKAARMKVIAMPEEDVKHDMIFKIADHSVPDLRTVFQLL